MKSCPYCGGKGPKIPGHCPHWPDLRPENCAICADARRILDLKGLLREWLHAGSSPELRDATKIALGMPR